MPYTCIPPHASHAPPTTTNSASSSILTSQNNLLHVRIHANKFQDNLLSKRLHQLNADEMKQRLRHQRTSNELIAFLRECNKTTGYLAQMRSPPTAFNHSYSSSCTSSSANFAEDTKRATTAKHQMFTLATTPQRRATTATTFASDSSSSDGFFSTTSSSNANSTTSSSSTTSSEASSLCSSAARQRQLKRFYGQQQESTTVRSAKPVFCPSTRLTLSNLDWFAEERRVAAVKKATLPPEVKLSRPLADLKSRSLNFGLSGQPTSILSKATPVVKASKKKLSFSLDAEAADGGRCGEGGVVVSSSPIKIRMSRGAIRRRQAEIVDEYSRLNAREVMSSLRQVQLELDAKVKVFTSRPLVDDE